MSDNAKILTGLTILAIFYSIFICMCSGCEDRGGKWVKEIGIGWHCLEAK